MPLRRRSAPSGTLIARCPRFAPVLWALTWAQPASPDSSQTHCNGELAHPFPHLNSRAGAPSLSRFLRQGGDFDFLSARRLASIDKISSNGEFEICAHPLGRRVFDAVTEKICSF